MNHGWLVQMGEADRPENGQQAIAVHGVSAGLPPNASYNVTFNCALDSWDSYNATTGPGTGYWDSFSISATADRYWLLPLSDPITFAPFIWGGGSYGDHILKTKTTSQTILLTSNTSAVTYLNVVLDTATPPDSDTNFPSWGKCTVNKVKPATSLGIFAAPN